MFLVKRKQAIMTGFLGLMLLVGILGCDKLPFLAKFFPSLKKEEPAKLEISTPVVSQTAMKPDTLAKVGAWSISKSEFTRKLDDLKKLFPDLDTNTLENKELILDELIRQQLLVADAEKRGLADNADITEAVKEFRRTLLVQEVVGKITDGLNVTDAEVRDFYEKNKNEYFAEPSEWHIREIVVPTQQEASDILIELLKQADFATMAKERSKGQSAANGGDLGFMKEFKFPQMESAVATLEVGQLSSVFKGPEGYYIIKLEEKKGGQPQDFTKVQEDLKAALEARKQQQAVSDYIEGLKQKASVETNKDLLKE